MRSHLKRWGALWLLIALWLGSTIAQFFTQLQVFRSEAEEHDQPFLWGDFLWDFGQATFENWQSEFLQLTIQVIITYLVVHKMFKGADESQEETIRNAVRKELQEFNK